MTARDLLILGLGLGVLGALLAFTLGLCQLAKAGDHDLLDDDVDLTSGYPAADRYILVYHGERYPCRDLPEAIEVTRTLAAIQRLPERSEVA